MRPTISVDIPRCTLCHICEHTCAAAREGTFDRRLARLRVDPGLEAGSQTTSCNGCLACVDGCPRQALDYDPDSGLLSLDEGQCDGCTVCVALCEYGVITISPVTAQAAFCDFCSGDPACVRSCPTGAMSYAR